MRSMQYGTAAKMPTWRTLPSASRTPSSVSRIDLGWPGRLMIRHLPRITATWRDRIAVGTKLRLMRRISSPKPGISLSPMASVASGVTSRTAGPVPPVVSTRLQPAVSTSSTRVRSISARSSGISRVSAVHGEVSALPSQSCSAGMPWSS